MRGVSALVLINKPNLHLIYHLIKDRSRQSNYCDGEAWTQKLRKFKCILNVGMYVYVTFNVKSPYIYSSLGIVVWMDLLGRGGLKYVLSLKLKQ